MRAAAIGCMLLVLCACAQTVYPAPAPRVLPDTVQREPATSDETTAPRINALERVCRTRLSGATAEASFAALDRVHEVLGASCEIASVGHDPLHWLVRCRSDALFASGSYTARAPDSACAELGGAKAPPLACLGAVLQTLLSREHGAALQELGVAVVGHADLQPLRARSDAHLCAALLTELGYQPPAPWSALAEDASDEERTYANNQLAFCRAASVTQALQRGMARARELAPQSSDAGDQRVDVAVLGVGASWLASQNGGSCPSTRKRYQDEHSCPDGRRVDLLLRFTPRLLATTSSCPLSGDDTASALACLERCYDEAAIDDRSERREPAAALFAPGPPPSEALPPGFYLQQLSPAQDRHLELGRVCHTLGIDQAHCPAPRVL